MWTSDQFYALRIAQFIFSLHKSQSSLGMLNAFITFVNIPVMFDLELSVRFPTYFPRNTFFSHIVMNSRM